MYNIYKEYREIFDNYCYKFFDGTSQFFWDFVSLTGLENVTNLRGIEWIGFKYGATAISEEIFHVFSLIVLIELLLVTAIFWIFFITLNSFVDKKFNVSSYTNKYKVYYSLYANKQFFTSKLIEFLWTLLPIIVLFLIGYPSLVLLYSLEERVNPELIVKVVGHQWYWHYECEGNNLRFEQFLPISAETIFEYINKCLSIPVNQKSKSNLLRPWSVRDKPQQRYWPHEI